MKNKLKYIDTRRLRSKFSCTVLEKWFFENFWGPFYDEVIFKDVSYLWSTERLKIKVKDLNLTLLTFWNLLAVRCFLEHYSHKIGLLSPIRQPEGYWMQAKFLLHFVVLIYIARLLHTKIFLYLINCKIKKICRKLQNFATDIV